jgi:hypothetical protein
VDDRTQSSDEPVFSLDERWRDAIDEASTEPELISVARSFVANVPEADLEALPPGWKPRHLRSAHDVSLITYRLAQAYCRPKLDEPCEHSMRSMLAFFQSLSQRLFAVRERDGRTSP